MIILNFVSNLLYLHVKTYRASSTNTKEISVNTTPSPSPC